MLNELGIDVRVPIVLVSAIAWILAIAAFADRPSMLGRSNLRFAVSAWIALVAVAGATRNVPYLSDLYVYTNQFGDAGRSTSLGAFVSSGGSDPGFSVVEWLLSRLSSDPRFFLGAVVLGTTTLFWLGIRRMFAPLPAVLVLFVSTLSPFYVAYISNTLREGLAIGLLALALSYGSAKGHQRLLQLTCLFAAATIHLSALLPALVVFALSIRLPREKTVALLWLASAALYLSGANLSVFGFLETGESRLSEYTTQGAISAYGRGVNRLDLLAFSFVIGLVLIWLFRLRSIREASPSDRVARRLVYAYFLFNSYFLCLGFVGYSDRLAAYSWLLAPIAIGSCLFGDVRAPHPAEALGFVLAGTAFTLVWAGWPQVLA